MEWKHLFSETIVGRGRLYYKQRVVQNIQKTEEEITASVIGTDNYNVSIKYGNNSIVSMGCNCPYAQSGENCKQMAAVLFECESVFPELMKEQDESKSVDINAEIVVPTPLVEEPEEQISEEQKADVIKLSKEKLELNIEIDDVLTYAVYQQGSKIISDVCVKNNAEEDIENLLLKIETDNKLIDLFTLGIDKINAGEELHFKDNR